VLPPLHDRPLPDRGVRALQPDGPAAGREVRGRHLFSFPSLAEYERYRTAVRVDEVAKEAWRLAEETRCILSFERSFMRPVFAPEP